MRCDAWVARAGVQVYVNPDGSTRREYRPPKEVFAAESLASLRGAPVTNEHPPTMVTGDNVRRYQVGTALTDGRQDGEHVAAELVVQDAATLRDVQSGKAELSCGYKLDIVKTAGVTPDGEAYDAIQTNIRINHVAIVQRGRAGSARLRLDGLTDEDIAYAMDAADAAQESNMNEELERLKAAVAALTTRAEKAEQALVAQTARADAAEAEVRTRTDAATQIPALVAARVKLEREAGKLLPEFRCDGASDADIQRAVIKLVDNEDLAKDGTQAHPIYLQARYDAAVKRGVAAAESKARVQEAMAGSAGAGRTDSIPSERDAAKKGLANLDAQRQAFLAGSAPKGA